MGDFRRQLSLFLLGLSLFLSSCSPFSKQKTPIILILLESFTEKDYLCSSNENSEGFTHLQQECEQFIRFTHSFAPSNLTQPNISSLLTGKEIADHGIKNNGGLAISGRFQTLAEVAISQQLRTGFFSGGVPLLPKFGVTQGYEIFTDGFGATPPRLFVPIRENIQRMLRWIDTEVSKKSFFTTLYIPDLLYKDLATRDNLDVERSIGRKSGLTEIYESLDFLIGELKKRKIWEESHVIFLGVSGEPVPVQANNSLSAHHFHMPLQIKPSIKVANNLNELVGQIVSFSDIGRWIEKMINHKVSKGSLLFSPKKEDSFLPQENRLKQWLGLSNWSTLGLRKRQFLFSFNPEPTVYDSFIDKKEIEPMGKSEVNALIEKYEVVDKIRSYFPNDCINNEVTKNCPPKSIDQIVIRSLTTLIQWSDKVWETESPTDDMAELVRRAKNNKSEVMSQWLAYRSLYEKKWTHLFELGKHSQIESWILIAQLNLRENLSAYPTGCLSYFVGERKNVDQFYRVCQNSGLRRVVDGLERLKKKLRPAESFWTEVAAIKSQRRALNINLKMHFINHLSGPFDFAPKLSELYFFLPENAEFQNLIDINES